MDLIGKKCLFKSIGKGIGKNQSYILRGVVVSYISHDACLLHSGHVVLEDWFVQVEENSDSTDYFQPTPPSTPDPSEEVELLIKELGKKWKKIKIYYVITNAGDGSAYLNWFSKEADAKKYEDAEFEGFSESTIGSIETFVGSNVYKEALSPK